MIKSAVVEVEVGVDRVSEILSQSLLRESMSNTKLGWGILGTAGIARKNWQAIRHSGNGTVVAVASRNVERSQQFIQECQADAPMERLPQAFGSYEELLAAKEVQAVYIPLPTGLRKEWVLRAARAGKHVVCEKPCAVNAADLQEMLDACRQNHVQFMDGVMFMHSKRLTRMREVLDDAQVIGDIRRINTAFSFGAPPNFFEENIRANSELEPQGCVGDLGWYCIRFILWAMRWQMPRRVSARLLSESNSVPTEFSAELYFDHGVSANFYCSFKTAFQSAVVVSGDKGLLHLDDFVLPVSEQDAAFYVNGFKHPAGGYEVPMFPRTHRYSISESVNGEPAAQEITLFRSFSDQVTSGELNIDWPSMALKTQLVVDMCLDSARCEK
jgi:predicted dehydrogenase